MRNNNLDACHNVTAAQGSLDLFFFILSLSFPNPPQMKEFCISSPHTSHHKPMSSLLQERVTFTNRACSKRHLRGSARWFFKLFFFLTALKGLLKLPGEQIHIFIIPPAQHFRHIYIPESIIIHNIQHLIYDSCHIWYKTPSEAINQPLHVKLPFIL